jgi:hypothetical protein
MNKTITLLIVGVIFLALLLMVLNSFIGTGGEQPRPLPSIAAEGNDRQEDEAFPASGRRAGERDAGFRSGPGDSPPSGASVRMPDGEAPVAPGKESGDLSPPEGVAVKTVPAQIDAGQPDFPSPPRPEASPPRPSPAPAAKRAPSGGSITDFVVFATQEGATLRIGGDHALEYRPMLLANPDRLVLDLAGQWKANAPAVPQNKIVKSVRVGRQAGATRLVIDLHRKPSSYRLIKTSPRGLDIRLR